MYLQFPWKLHEMLRDAEKDPSIVSWLSHGKAFRVHKPKEFVEKVMAIYFRQSHYKSFQRQLNLWGFERVSKGEEVGAYYHNFFVRGEPGLCGYMTRQKIKGGGTFNEDDPSPGPKAGHGRRNSLPPDLVADARMEHDSKTMKSARRSSCMPAGSSSSLPPSLRSPLQQAEAHAEKSKASFNPLDALADLALMADSSTGVSKPKPELSPETSKEDSKPPPTDHGYVSTGVAAASRRSSFPMPAAAATGRKSIFPMPAMNAGIGVARPSHARASSISEGIRPSSVKEDSKFATSLEERKPKRPMSAYNIFFEHQRNLMLAGETKEPTLEEFIQSIECIILNGEDETKPAVMEISFEDLSQQIAQQWKTIDPVNKAILDCYAAQEMRRYETEVKLWREQRDTGLPVPIAPKAHPTAASTNGDVIRALRQYSDTKILTSMSDAMSSRVAMAARLDTLFGPAGSRDAAQSAINSRFMPPFLTQMSARALPNTNSEQIKLEILARSEMVNMSPSYEAQSAKARLDDTRERVRKSTSDNNLKKPAENDPKHRARTTGEEDVKQGEHTEKTESKPISARKSDETKLPFKKRRASLISSAIEDNNRSSQELGNVTSPKMAIAGIEYEKPAERPEAGVGTGAKNTINESPRSNHDDEEMDDSSNDDGDAEIPDDDDSAGDDSESAGDSGSERQTKQPRIKRGPYLVKRGGWKKPPGKPKRPLSAYNMFFTYERNRIVAGEKEYPSVDEFKRGIRQILETPKERRVHRKTCAGVGFQDLARRIALKWKNIDAGSKAILDDFASKEMTRYKDAVRHWKTQEATAEPEASQTSNPEGRGETLSNDDDAHGDSNETDKSDDIRLEPKPAPVAMSHKSESVPSHQFTQHDISSYERPRQLESVLHFPCMTQRPILDFLRGGTPSERVGQVPNVVERPILGFLRGGPQVEGITHSMFGTPLDQSRASLVNALRMAPTGYQLPFSMLREQTTAALTPGAKPPAAMLLGSVEGVPTAHSEAHLADAEKQNLASTKKGGWKKPKGKPKRPLSSYNIFYQIERNRIVAGRERSPTGDDLVRDVENVLYTRKEKRPHRKTHGTISFQDLSREIANNWKEIDADYKVILDSYAAKDLDRYRNEVKVWESSKGESDKDDSSESGDETAQSVGNSKIDSGKPNFDEDRMNADRKTHLSDQIHSNEEAEGEMHAGIVQSEVPFPTPFGSKNDKQQTMPFPFALHNMLHFAQLEGKSSIVSWLPHGRAFRVKNKESFVATMMSTHFKQTKFKSFQRQLNLWGFTRITDGADAGAYYHKYFIRKDPALCQMMTRQKVKGGASAHHQAYSSSIEQAKASDEAVSALCSLSTLGACASASDNTVDSAAGLGSHTNRTNSTLPSGANYGNGNSAAVTPEADSGSDGDRSPSALGKVDSRERERAIFLSNLALKDTPLVTYEV